MKYRCKTKKAGAFLLCLLTFCILALGGCAGAETRRESAADTSVPSGADTGEEGPASSESVYAYEMQELCALRDGLRIYGVIFIPQDAGEKMPAVIISHGFGGTHTAGRQYAETLAQNGYVTYCFDFCGGSPGSQSDGSTLEMSLFTEQADLEAVISMIQGLPYVDSENLFLMGTSQGAPFRPSPARPIRRKSAAWCCCIRLL